MGMAQTEPFFKSISVMDCTTSYHMTSSETGREVRATELTSREILIFVATAKHPGHRYEHNRPHSGRRKAVQKSSAGDVELRENPATQYCADETDEDVTDATESAPARKFPCEPPGDESDKDPSNQ